MSDRSETTTRGHARFPWPQLVSMIAGLALILFGLFSFWPTSFTPLTDGDAGRTLLGVQVSPLRNLIHLVLGLIGLVCATRLLAARAFGWLLAAAGVVMTVMGIVGLVDPRLDVLSMNVPAVAVAAVLALIGIATAVAPARSAVGTGDPEDGRNPTGDAAVRGDEA